LAEVTSSAGRSTSVARQPLTVPPVKLTTVANSCQLDRTHCQTAGASRTERSAARQVGGIVVCTNVLRSMPYRCISTTTTSTTVWLPALLTARGPVVGILSGGRGILLVVVDPALDTRGTRTLGSTNGLDDVTLAETGRLIRLTDVSEHSIHYTLDLVVQKHSSGQGMSTAVCLSPYVCHYI